MGLLFVTQGMHLRTEIKNGDETKDGAVTETAGIGKNKFKGYR